MLIMSRGLYWMFLFGCSMIVVSLFHTSTAIPFYPSNYNNHKHRDYLVEVEDPDAVLDMLAKLGQSILRAQHEGSNAKRGLDLGLGRGFSGSQAAKHLMGLAAANFAAGPGKKKRGGDDIMYNGLGIGGTDMGMDYPISNYAQSHSALASPSMDLGIGNSPQQEAPSVINRNAVGSSENEFINSRGTGTNKE